MSYTSNKPFTAVVISDDEERLGAFEEAIQGYEDVMVIVDPDASNPISSSEGVTLPEPVSTANSGSRWINHL